MINEEISNKTVRIAISTVKLSGKTVYQALKKFVDNARKKLEQKNAQKSVKKDEKITGKQSVKDLIQQGQTLNSMDLSDDGIRDFFRIAKKYGIDFAVVKDTSGDQPKYIVFFKAKDIDVIEAVLREYAAKQMKKQKKKEKPSILEKLKKFKENVKNTPRRDREKRKEQER